MVIMTFSITPAQAVLAWEEDFDGIMIGDLTDWDFYGWDMQGNNHDPQIDPGFGILGGVLRSPNYTDLGNNSRTHRDSTVAYGMWSFDWFPSTDAINAVEIILNEPEGNFNLTGILETDVTFTGYALAFYHGDFGPSPSIELLKLHQIGGRFTPTILDSYQFLSEITMPIHIEVNRNLEGRFEVKLDSSVILEATDNEFTESQKFGFTTWVGYTGIDNIIVDTEFSFDDDDGTITALPRAMFVWTVFSTGILFIQLKKKMKKK